MSETIKLQSEEILDRRWRFKRADGSIIATDLRFAEGGSLRNHSHENERTWSLSDGCLTFHSASGAVTTRFTTVRRTPLGLVLAGEFQAMNHGTKPVVHILEDMGSRDSLNADVRREIFGQVSDSCDVDKVAFLAAAISSSQYATERMPGASRFSDTLGLLDFAVSQIGIKGLHLEFGVFSGRTLNHLAQRLPEERWFGFDSFEGLPEDWRPGFPKGAFARQPPEVRPNVELVVGWFENSLGKFLSAHSKEKVAFLHVDCDLYSSTEVIFKELKKRIVPGAIIVFDEYFNYPGWERGEYLAFQQFVDANKIKYEYIGLVPSHQQVAVRLV